MGKLNAFLSIFLLASSLIWPGTAIASGPISLGCFKDSATRDLDGFSIKQGGMTAKKCISICKGKKFNFAGTQYGTWCMCGNTYGKQGVSDKCNMPCSGDRNEICGGPWTNNVYATFSESVGQPFGCFTDKPARDLEGPMKTDKKMNSKMCVDFCKSKDFKYAGTQAGSQCFCGNTYGAYGPSSGCTANCGGNGKEKCGGRWANLIYSAGGSGSSGIWLPAGQKAPKEAEVGKSAGKPLYVCRFQIASGEVHSGKAWNNSCYVGYGGKEIKKPLAQADILVAKGAKWTAVKGGKVPANTVLVNNVKGGPMHVCRSKVKNGEMHPGKLWRNNCYVGFGGRELKNAAYEVLVAAGSASGGSAPASGGAITPPKLPKHIQLSNHMELRPKNAKEIGKHGDKIAIEGPSWEIYYGVGNKFKKLKGSGRMPLHCNPSTFGGDPYPGANTKKCYAVQQCEPAQKAEGMRPKFDGKCWEVGKHVKVVKSCADDNGTCSHNGAGHIVYGVIGQGRYVTKTVDKKGSLKCNPATFGKDPAPNVAKNCFYFPRTHDSQKVEMTFSDRMGVPITLEIGDTMKYKYAKGISKWSVKNGKGKPEDYVKVDHKPTPGGGYQSSKFSAGDMLLTGLKPGTLSFELDWVKHNMVANIMTEIIVKPNVPVENKYPFNHTKHIAIPKGEIFVLHAGYPLGRLCKEHRVRPVDGTVKLLHTAAHLNNDYVKADTHYFRAEKVGMTYLPIAVYDCENGQSMYRGPWHNMFVKVYEP